MFVRYLVALSVALLAFAGVAAGVVDAQPDWYLRTRYPLEYEQVVRAHARNYDLDPTLLAAVIYAESRFDPNVVSDAGAVGLMQLLPETAKGIAVVRAARGSSSPISATRRSTCATGPGTSTIFVTATAET